MFTGTLILIIDLTIVPAEPHSFSSFIHGNNRRTPDFHPGTTRPWVLATLNLLKLLIVNMLLKFFYWNFPEIVIWFAVLIFSSTPNRSRTAKYRRPKRFANLPPPKSLSRPAATHWTSLPCKNRNTATSVVHRHASMNQRLNHTPQQSPEVLAMWTTRRQPRPASSLPRKPPLNCFFAPSSE